MSEKGTDINIEGNAIAGALLIISGVYLGTLWLILLGFVVLFFQMIIIGIVFIIGLVITSFK